MKTLKTITALSVGLLAGGLALAASSGEGSCSSGMCSVQQKPVSEEGFQLLSTGEMKKVVEAKSATILDARSGKYDDGRRIPGAKSLNAESTKEEVAKLLPDKGAPVVTYCSNLKCPASGMLAKHLKSLGYTNIREYPEGIQGWSADGNKVESVEKK